MRFMLYFGKMVFLPKNDRFFQKYSVYAMKKRIFYVIYALIITEYYSIHAII